MSKKYRTNSNFINLNNTQYINVKNIVYKNLYVNVVDQAYIKIATDDAYKHGTLFKSIRIKYKSESATILWLDGKLFRHI